MKTPTFSYYHPLFRKLDKTLLLKRFDELLILNNSKDMTPSLMKRTFIELFVVSISYNIELNNIKDNMDIINEVWLDNIKPLTKKFTPSFFNIDDSYFFKTSNLFLDFLSINNIDNLLLYIKELKTDMHLAEYRGVELEEEIIFPPGVITTSERRPFFENLFPDNIKW